MPDIFLLSAEKSYGSKVKSRAPTLGLEDLEAFGSNSMKSQNNRKLPNDTHGKTDTNSIENTTKSRKTDLPKNRESH